MSKLNDNNNNINNINNSINTQSEENKKVLYNKIKSTTEKQTDTNNNINDILIKDSDNDNNTNNILNTSNDIYNSEDNNIKRTLISPDISPDAIKVKGNNKNLDDNFSNNLISTEEDYNNFNCDPFISPTMKKRNYKTISKMDKIIIEYNMVKNNINKILLSYENQNKTKKEKYIKKLSEYNISLLNHLSELSNLLNKIVDNQKIYTNKNLIYSSTDTKPKPKIIFVNNTPTIGLENTEKMLNLYERQYTKVTERLKKIKNEQYANDLKSKINNLNKEISIIEQENRDLHKKQIIQGNLLKNNGSPDQSPELMENNLKKKKEICDKVQNEFIKTSKKIENNKEHIKSNEEKINILNEKCNNLTQMAKDMYDIEQFESIDKIKKRSKEKKIKFERKKREYEINIHSIKSNINKLKNMYEQNKKELQFMEIEKNALIEKFQKKQYELDLCSKKLRDYQNINMNFKSENSNKNENGKIIVYNVNGKNSSNDLKEIKRRKLSIKIDSFNNKNNIINKTSKNNENKEIKIANIKKMNIEKINIYDNNIKNHKKNNIALLLSSGPSLISLTKEKSNFADINDIQLLNTPLNEKNDKNSNYNLEFKSDIEDTPKKAINQKDNKYIINKEITNINNNNKNKNKDMNQINNEVVNINIINEPNDKKKELIEDKIKSNTININNKEKNKKYLSPIKLNNDNNQEKTLNAIIGANSLSKEMILKGLDEQEKENRTLGYSSRGNKGHFDRRNLLKLNFSFVSAKKDNKLNRSLNNLPNERNLLNDEIEEDIIIDNSADNINIKETKVKKFVTEESEKDLNINLDKDIDKEKNKDKNNNNDNNKLNANNNSIEIDKNMINIYKNENKEDTNIVEDIIENNKENEDKSQLEDVDKNKRENALNTILYNVNENNQETKNDKFSQNNKTNNNEENKEEVVNKSFEEEHIFEKKNTKEENDDVNYDFEDGDNIIDIDYDKI